MEISQHADNILRLLASSKNVLLMGPPATGKSKIMSLVATKFLGAPGAGLRPGSSVPIPATTTSSIEAWMPSPSRLTERKIFPITFHQGTKHRDFVSGIIPRLKEGESGFRVIDGVLLQANQNAIDQRGASLVTVDELNRGPAVSIFGDTLASIERDKRLKEDDTPSPDSAPFYTYDEETDNPVPNHLSPHVYILSSMNEADTSVEPLDVAFLRRFEIYRLEPDTDKAYHFFGIGESTTAPESASESKHVLAALVRAWKKVNEKISTGKSDAYCIGHGILMLDPPPTSLETSLTFAVQCWKRIESHVREVFYANDVAQGFIFNAKEGHVFSITETEFAEQQVSKLSNTKVDTLNIYSLLVQVARNAEE